jgi:hypothetical protein
MLEWKGVKGRTSGLDLLLSVTPAPPTLFLACARGVVARAAHSPWLGPVLALISSHTAPLSPIDFVTAPAKWASLGYLSQRSGTRQYRRPPLQRFSSRIPSLDHVTRHRDAACHSATLPPARRDPPNFHSEPQHHGAAVAPSTPPRELSALTPTPTTAPTTMRPSTSTRTPRLPRSNGMPSTTRPPLSSPPSTST